MPSFVTAFTQDQGSNASWTIDNEGGFQDGDTIFFFVSSNSDHVISAGPAGSTQIGVTQTDGVDSSSSLFVKDAADEPGSWSLGFAAPELGTVAVVVYRGMNPAHLIAGTAAWFAQATSTGTTVSGPTVTPTEDYSTIVQFCATDPNSAITGTADSSPAATARVDHIFGSDAYIFVQDYLLPTAGAIGLDATFSASDAYTRFTIAMAPGDVEVRTFLSGGAANEDNAASTGGAESGTAASDVFADVTDAVARVGVITYRGVYLRNTDVARSASMLAWITEQASGTQEVAIGVAAEAAGAEMESLVDDSTAPEGVVFSTPAIVGDAVDVGTLAAGQSRGLWVRRTVDPVTAADPSVPWEITGQVTTL